MNWLVPLPVAGPLAIAGVTLAVSHLLPRRVPDVVAITTAIAAAVFCALLARASLLAPVVYWFGGWAPRDGLVLGIGFVVDPIGAGLGAFIAFLFAATFLFAWGYFDEVHAHFHVLMLLFLAAMIGFCLTHDLFNMFVWFEVMSVAGFALTGYRLENSALGGALNFTVVNGIGSYLMLAGIGLIYTRAGALDFSALAAGIGHKADPVVEAAFALVACALLIKAAQVPFQFWLSDAHAVAPSPVSVIFSGAMVSIGVFGVARLYWAVFAGLPPIDHVAGTILLGMGGASAIVGGIMCVLQRHVKRMLAFSTVSHVGLILVGFALLDGTSNSGMLLYLLGHGLVKGALFMVAGVLLATCASIDELDLHGVGRKIWPAGLAMGLGGLFLAGLPWGVMDEGSRLIESAAGGRLWPTAALFIGSAATGGTVLRATGRIFLGLGRAPDDEEAQAPTEQEQEAADRPLWLMLVPTSLLLALAAAPADPIRQFVTAHIGTFVHPDQAGVLLGRYGSHPQTPIAAAGSVLPWASLAGAILLAAYDLYGHKLPPSFSGVVDRVKNTPLHWLQTLHSGRIGDYVAWLALGVAAFAVAFALA